MSEQEIALREGKFCGGGAGDDLAVGSDFVGFGVDLDLRGGVVVDHVALADLAARYPEAIFLGKLGGEALAAAYAGADVFAFPSRTDTFGLVVIEALSCGTPVAAYPVPGPGDIVTGGAGALDEDLDVAIARALACDRAEAAALGARYSWSACTAQFLNALTFVPAEPVASPAGAALAA